VNPYFQNDQCRIYNGDCLAVMSELEDDSVDVILTDPPYSSGARNSASLRNRGSMTRSTGKHGKKWFGCDNLSSHGFAMLIRLVMVEAFRVCKKDGHLFRFIDWRQWPVLAGVTEAAGWMLRSCITWDKEHFGMGNGFRQQSEFILHASKGTGDNFLRHDLGTVMRHKREASDQHPTMKPEPLLEKLLSAVPGETVLDPFMGSGSTLLAARTLDRRAIGIEMSAEYCELAVKRLDQGTLF